MDLQALSSVVGHFFSADGPFVISPIFKELFPLKQATKDRPTPVLWQRPFLQDFGDIAIISFVGVPSKI